MTDSSQHLDSSSPFRSITGVPESSEPANTSIVDDNNNTNNTSSPLPSAAMAATTATPTHTHSHSHSHSHTPTQTLRDHLPLATRTQTPSPASDSAQTRRQAALMNGMSRPLNISTPSTANSSRESSPARSSQRQKSVSTAPRPRNGSDASPNRGPSLPGSSTTVPSAAAIQRALSSASIPQLQPAPSQAAQDTARVPRPTKPASASNSGDTTPHWPPSPRFKSPPPNPDTRSRSRRNSLRGQSRKAEPVSTPSIVVLSSSPASTVRVPIKDEAVASDAEEPQQQQQQQQQQPQQQSSIKPMSRGPSGVASKLETVQEGSLPATPGYDGSELQSFNSAQIPKTPDELRNDVAPSKVTEDLSAKPTTYTHAHTESGSDTPTTTPVATKHASKNNTMQEYRSASTQRPPPSLSSKSSLASLSTVKARTEPSRNNMTVETETVPSVPQATIGNQERSTSGRVDGSLRLKPSNETIRPKKEKPKKARKAPSINSGTASSKADVFEQKVASAVDEANSSDSDATFIYESNPPEQQPHRSRRHHSRTPSMTSVASLADPRAIVREAHKKSSMKFANPYSNPNVEAEGSERGDGPIRVGSGRVSGGSHHHHIGRHGQGRGALSHVLVDSDSSMAQSSRIRGPSSRQPSQPNSPRFHTFNVGNGSGNGSINGNGSNKHSEYSAYDIDTENAADDERTPLISAGRGQRTRTPRQRNITAMRHMERRHHRNSGWCRRFAGCLVLSIIVLVLVFSAVGLVFATTKPLMDVKVREIQNVVASQEELMLDLVVDAVNPNVIGITVADMDVNIFVKSKHVGSDKWWREHGGRQRNEEDWKPISEQSTHTTGGVDEGTDPIADPSVGEPRTMLLGRIFHFDSPLNFEGYPFKRQKVQSLGGMRLSNPGNKTETGGAERWEEVLQYPFELILQGYFKYQLPLSTRENTVSISATYFYDPDTERKKLKKIEQKRNLLPQPVKISPKSWGRYDARARKPAPLLDP